MILSLALLHKLGNQFTGFYSWLPSSSGSLPTNHVRAAAKISAGGVGRVLGSNLVKSYQP